MGTTRGGVHMRLAFARGESGKPRSSQCGDRLGIADLLGVDGSSSRPGGGLEDEWGV
jgi:hypothetical protein